MKQVLLPILGVMAFIIFVGLLSQENKDSQLKSFLFQQKPGITDDQKKVKVKDKEVVVEVADTNSERQKGLSGKTGLGENEGMLFIFDKKDVRPSFWMKDMNFPIDIIWINDGKIVQIDKEAKPEPGVSDKNLKIYTPSNPIDYVLEVKSGFSDNIGFSIGDSVDIP